MGDGLIAPTLRSEEHHHFASPSRDLLDATDRLRQYFVGPEETSPSIFSRYEGSEGRSPSSVAGRSRRSRPRDLNENVRWQELWDLFEQLEKTWNPASLNSKVTTLRQLFSLLADLELQLKQSRGENARLRVHHVRSVAPYLRKFLWERQNNVLAACLTNWFEYLLHTQHATTKEHLGVHKANVHRTQLVDCFKSEEMSTLRTGLRGIVICWRQLARHHREHIVTKRQCVLLMLSSAPRLLLITAMSEWRLMVQEAHKTQLKADGKLAEFDVQAKLQRQEDEIERLERRLRQTVKRNELLAAQCVASKRSLLLWNGLIDQQSLDGEEKEGEEGIAKRASSAASRRERERLSQQRTADLEALKKHQEALRRELHELADRHSDLQKERWEAQDTVEGFKGHMSKAQGEASREYVRRQMYEAERILEGLTQEHHQISQRKADLQKALQSTESRVEHLAFHHNEALTDHLDEAYAYIEKTLTREHRRGQDLESFLRKVEEERDAWKAKYHEEVVNDKTQVAEMVRKHEGDLQEESRLYAQRTSTLEHQLKEARLWIDHLKEQNTIHALKQRELRGKELELNDIKEALGTLTEVNEQFLQSQQRLETQHIMSPRPTGQEKVEERLIQEAPGGPNRGAVYATVHSQGSPRLVSVPQGSPRPEVTSTNPTLVGQIAPAQNLFPVSAPQQTVPIGTGSRPLPVSHGGLPRRFSQLGVPLAGVTPGVAYVV